MPGPANETRRKKRQSKKQKAKKSAASGTNQPSSPTVASPNRPHAQSPLESASDAVDEGTTSGRVNAVPSSPLQNNARRETNRADGGEAVADTAAAAARASTRRMDGGRGGDQIEEPMGEREGDGEETEEEALIRLFESSTSYIYDPGNGPRVRDFLAFMKSPFAAPQALSFLVVGSEEDTSGGGEGEVDDQRYSAATVIPILNKFLPGEFATVCPPSCFSPCWVFPLPKTLPSYLQASTDFHLILVCFLCTSSSGSTALAKHSASARRVRGCTT